MAGGCADPFVLEGDGRSRWAGGSRCRGKARPGGAAVAGEWALRVAGPLPRGGGVQPSQAFSLAAPASALKPCCPEPQASPPGHLPRLPQVEPCLVSPAPRPRAETPDGSAALGRQKGRAYGQGPRGLSRSPPHQQPAGQALQTGSPLAPGLRSPGPLQPGPRRSACCLAAPSPETGRAWRSLSVGIFIQRIPELGRRVSSGRRQVLPAPGVGEGVGELCRARSLGMSPCPQQLSGGGRRAGGRVEPPPHRYPPVQV